MRRELAALILTAVALAGCGGGGGSAGTSTTATVGAAAARPSAPVLVVFQRNGGIAATLDLLTVYTDGTARLDKRYGGAGRQYTDFALTSTSRIELTRALLRFPQRLGPASGTAVDRGARYLMRFHGRSYGAVEGAVPNTARAAFATLNALVDGDGRGRELDRRRQAPPS